MGRLIAVGDIHGHLMKLDRLLARLEPSPDDKMVFLGDYIDRGPDPFGVVERLIELKARLDKVVFLKGNHEDMFLNGFLNGQNPKLFFYNGGLSTVESYALRGVVLPLDPLPKAHWKFFSGLELFHRSAGCLFVHAGLRPGRPLEAQDPDDLLWIREEFFNVEADWPETIVFGHTPFARVLFGEGIVGLDTGAAYGGPLSALILPDLEVVRAF